MQLDMFVDKKTPEMVEVELVKELVTKVKTSSDNVRRGIFARHTEMSKLYLELKDIVEKQQAEIKDLRRALGENYGKFESHAGELFALPSKTGTG